MLGVWLVIVVICGQADCRTEVDGIYASKALCLAEADRLASLYWRIDGFGCAPSLPRPTIIAGRAAS